ncbi:MAG: PAC2 family protein [Nanoarchaeota archaeon]|nr:PAC2 family protein [Nanoarchaeota archaeon]
MSTMNPFEKIRTNRKPENVGIHLTKKPKNPIIIEGFPGFGLVGTIATEFLIEHLKTEEIGKVWFEDMPAIIAIHDGKTINPIGIFYNEKYNIVIVHSISSLSGFEWRTANIIKDIANQLNAKEIICLEGIGTTELPSEEKEVKIEDIKTLYCGNNETSENKLNALGAEKLNESILMGIVPALMLKNQENLTCIFAETYSNLPDSKAAAKLVQILDKYLGLDVDYKPLVDMAEKFEIKLKSILEKSQKAVKEHDEKRPNYFG